MDFMIKFGERLQEYMDDKNLNAPALAKILEIDRSNVTRYLLGERSPNFSTLLNILNLFNCSADYLLGITDYPPDNVVFHEPTQPFNLRLRYVIEHCGYTQYRLDKKEGFSNSAIHYWLTGRKLPSMGSLIDLANKMNCSIDFILGRID